MVTEPVLDGRRVEDLMQELRRYAPQYTPELNLADDQSVGPALMHIFARLTETVLVRLGRTPQKHFIAFLDRIGISLLPARPARAAVTFRLSSGLNDTVVVPAGTRVTAAGVDDDIPFETTGALLALPGALTAAYGVDPAGDSIYRPPPGFLAQQIRVPTELVYEVQTFASAGARRLQLDHVTELATGSYLRIGGREKAVVKTVEEGSFVTLDAPLSQDVEAETTVTPIRDFEVFNGIDVQEHVLYLGHADLFTVKEAAEISIDITLVEASASGLAAFNVAWQFWTTLDAETADEREDWRDLTVVSDGTAGFSTSGRVVLLKPDTFEIKEREVGGRKSRWIRAQLLDKLTDDRALPDIDTIAVAVKSDQEAGIAADQGFHNVTPIDLQVESNVGFFPFGTEPRQFDQFYIASKEAFSKRESVVTLDFKLDLQTLAAPSLIKSAGGLRAYSIGLRRRLYELEIPGGNWVLLGNPNTDHPQGAGYLPVEDSAPSVITNSTRDLIYAFVKTEDTLATEPATATHKVWVHFHRSNGTSKTWVDLGAPAPSSGSKQLKFNPAAVVMPFGPAFARVFVVGGDDKLYSRGISSAPGPLDNEWQLHESPSGAPWASSPFVTKVGSTVLVFITGTDGLVHRLTISGTSTWTTLTPDNQSFHAVSTPFAQAFGAAEAKVFVFGEQMGNDWKLFECDTRNETAGEFNWTDLGRPSTNVGIDRRPDAHAPTGYVEDPAGAIDEENKHIFLRGGDSRLYERLDEEITAGTDGWELRTRPGDPLLRDSPVALADVDGSPPLTVIHVVSASSGNSLVTWTSEILRVVPPANALGQAVLLDTTKAASEDGAYTDKTLMLTKGAAEEDRVVLAYDGARRLARLALPPLPFVPDSTTSCVIDEEDVGPCDDDSNKLLAVHSPASDTRVARTIYVRVAGNLVSENFYSRLTGVASLEIADLPATTDEVAVYQDVLPARAEFLSVEDTGTVPELSWEYWNGRGWLSLTVNDGTRNFLAGGKVVFTVPKSIEPTEVAGQENFWIRVRLVGGDYGRETFKIVNDTVVSEKNSLRPPKIESLRIFYDAPLIPPGVCLTFNNLDYLDQTAACQIGGAHFAPFQPLERIPDRSFTVFFGFDKPFKTGPVRLLIDAAEREFDERRPPELDWRFRKDRRWKPLDAEDGSVALTRQGVLTLSASEELTLENRFGQSLFWIAGSLRTDRGGSHAAYPLPLLHGIFLNTVWALQGETITDEIVGSSDGEPNQAVRLQHADVLEREDIRVREAVSVEEQEQIARESGKDSITLREDIGGTWIRWRETLALFDAGPNDRCYLLDRAAGVVQFGDGVHGRIPPAGVDNVRAFSYRTGGGAAGNVEAGKIDNLVTAVAGVESVFNPTPTGGGSDKATTEAMLTIGPRRISHRDRAVSAEDFEELAHEASRQVAKARCLAGTNLARRGAGTVDPCDRTLRHDARLTPGWVSLILVPDSQDARPCPSLELRRTVKDFLRQRSASVLSSGERIVIRPPDYVDVAVEADIFVTSLEQAAAAETKARTRLETLLHPLRGGTDGKGWEFGRPIWKSDVFAALEEIEEIDRVENLRFRVRGGTSADRVVIGPNELLASGQHLLAIKQA